MSSSVKIVNKKLRIHLVRQYLSVPHRHFEGGQACPPANTRRTPRHTPPRTPSPPVPVNHQSKTDPDSLDTLNPDSLNSLNPDSLRF